MAIRAKDKGYHNVSVYSEDGCGFKIYTITDGYAGYIRKWTLSVGPKNYQGTNATDFIETLKDIIDERNLKKYSEHKKDIIVIYTEELNYIRGFFKDYVTEDFALYVQLLDFFEFREISDWSEDVHTAREIATYADFLMTNVFKPYNKVFLTPNQKTRHKIMLKAKEYEDETAKDIYPKNPDIYFYLKMGLFGGLNYFLKRGIIDEPMVEFDLNSAYIFDFLVEAHCMSAFVPVDTENWEYYMSSTNKGSLGRYKIKYLAKSRKVHCYKDINAVNCEYGEHTQMFIFNNVDLKTFLSLVDAAVVECCYLFECEMGSIPKYLMDVLVEEYTKKVELKHEDELAYALQKIVLNGIYGGSIRRLEDSLEIKKDKKKTVFAPQWGVWTCSYCKKYLIALANNLDGWCYSDTDSIFCLDTPENRAKVEAFNNKIRAKVKDFCDKFGYDYEVLKNLGTFEEECKISKFKTWKNKVYAYKDAETGEVTVKAAGCNKKEVGNDDSVFDLENIQMGTKLFGFFTSNHHEADIDGVHYESESSYYEIPAKGKLAEFLVKLAILQKVQLKHKDN
jgi:hypothetical protein